jgi:hypothetical protein
MKKFLALICTGFMALNFCGCVALLAGAAGGAGTAAWLSGKMVEEVNSPYDKVVTATKSTLASMQLPITSETQVKGVDQIRSTYTDGRKIWIDIRSMSSTSSKIEIRVGALGDKATSDTLLKKITSSL